MIFCTVGNDHHKFDRFVELIDKVYSHFTGNTEMFLQHGYSSKSNVLTTQDAFLSKDSFRNFQKGAASRPGPSSRAADRRAKARACSEAAGFLGTSEAAQPTR